MLFIFYEYTDTRDGTRSLNDDKINHGSLQYDWTMAMLIRGFAFNSETACNCFPVSILALEREFLIKEWMENNVK